MKKENKLIKGLHYLCLSLVFVIGLVAIIGTGGCGGGSSGGGGGGGGSTSLATGEFTKTVTLPGSSQWTAPFVTTDQHQQQLYLASDINGAGYIQSIELRLDIDETGCNCPDVTIKMGHTSLGGLTTTFANNVEQGKGTLETVHTGPFSVPAGLAGDYFAIILDTPFLYNGVDNLVVDFLVTACDDAISLRRDNTSLVDGALWVDSLTSPTGTLFSSVIHSRLNFEGGVNPIDFAPIPSDGNNIPFGGVSEKVQLLYDATIINGSGPITGIAMRVGVAATADRSYTYAMRVGHSTLTDLTTDFNGNFSDTPVTVADNVVLNIPAGVPVGDYIWLPMPDGSFNYNGNDSLIVEVDVSSSSGVTWWGQETFGTDLTRAWGDSGSDTATAVGTDKYHISFRFNGGTMDVITAGDADWPPPFNDDDNTSQILFGAQQLGTGGPVSGISFRLANDSAASDYASSIIVLGHTDNPVLSTTYAANMTDPTTVFTGTITIPAGLIAGDWFTIPTSGFTYDPTQNLVLEVTVDPGTAGNDILATDVDVPGPSGGITGVRGIPVATASTLGQCDVRIHLSK